MRNIGLGDIIAYLTKKLGIKQRAGCGCQQRQEWLNQSFPKVLRLKDKP